MKTLKKIISLVLVVALFAAVLSFTACNKKDDKDDNNGSNNNGGNNDNVYTVTVLDENNAPLKDVGVGVLINGEFSTLTTDANGKVTFEAEDASSMARIMSVPAGYDRPNDLLGFTAGSKEITFTVKKTVVNEVDCVVTVVDQDGNAVAGVSLQLCANACINGTTNENGEATFKLTKNSEYKVEILSVPAGYTAPTGYLSETVFGGTTYFTVEITKI